MKKSSEILLLICLVLSISSCRKDKPLSVDIDYKGYPPEIGKIIINNCAVAGCHDDNSKATSEGLSLSSWEKLFEGTENKNAAVIPYHAHLSPLIMFTNTYSDLGLQAQPTMPYQRSPLSRGDIITLKKWVDAGAPNDKGFVKFSDNPNRSKIYITDQGCDYVTVIDAQTKLTMGYVHVGNNSNTESPHMVRVSPDGKYWYVIFTLGQVIQKFDASNDAFIGQIDIGAGNWNTFTISPDGKKAFIVNWRDEGSIVYVDLENLKLLKTYQGSGLFYYPHGIAANKAFNTLYVTGQTGNFIYKIDITDVNFPDISEIYLDGGSVKITNSLFDPHEITLSPDETKYFITCQKSNELRVIQTSNDSLLATIPTGIEPQDMSLSVSKNLLFVSCMEDTVLFPGTRGVVSVIDYTTFSVQNIGGSFYQPHGVAVDDANGAVYVANRNINPDGPAPHHTNNCGGRNGFVSLIDLNTLTIISDYKPELSVDPFSVAVRK